MAQPRPHGGEERQCNESVVRTERSGSSIWLDDLSRERLVSGSLAKLVEDDHVVGVTTNPTIFAKAITHGEAYDGQIGDLTARGAGLVRPCGR